MHIHLDAVGGINQSGGEHRRDMVEYTHLADMNLVRICARQVETAFKKILVQVMEKIEHSIQLQCHPKSSRGYETRVVQHINETKLIKERDLDHHHTNRGIHYMCLAKMGYPTQC